MFAKSIFKDFAQFVATNLVIANKTWFEQINHYANKNIDVYGYNWIFMHIEPSMKT